jgi:hypothetical protein
MKNGKKFWDVDKPLWATVGMTAGLTIFFLGASLKYAVHGTGKLITIDYGIGIFLLVVGLVLACMHEKSRKST